ncbi:MAG: aryl-sulfate sulfotransferase [Saprospiraceae bacterium]|nr:aryl-sulfate sulfotransferase [Saprospiraceae bacterium]
MAVSGQQTVGLFLNDPASFNGYTLFGNNGTTYLIDNCGRTVNTWESDHHPGQGQYLLPDGSLLRTARVSGSFSGGGLGGRFERFSWDGQLLWSYRYADGTVHAHHDIVPMPNGHFLAIAWERHAASEAQARGRIWPGEVWSERIIEVQMVGSSKANIVWEWRLWDHLVQDTDPSKPDFGESADHPGRIDINYLSPDADQNSDWIHANAIDYHPELDQIVISARNFNEIWVIDHSTSTEEAAGSKGGRSGRGGDLLYRYGNPGAYGREPAGTLHFGQQHDVRWVPEGYPHAGKLMVFNNEAASGASEVIIWTPPVLSDGTYTLKTGTAYGPAKADWTYQAPDFYSPILSGAHLLPNGNVLICEGKQGRFFEVTGAGQMVWEYINPVNRNGFPAAQGGSVHFNEVFRATRYPVDFSGFAGRDLAPGAPVEINPWESDCEIHEETVSAGDPAGSQMRVLGNPFHGQLTLDSPFAQTLRIYNIEGCQVLSARLTHGVNHIHMDALPGGTYLLVAGADAATHSVRKVIKI